jgi:hypothetical protein
MSHLEIDFKLRLQELYGEHVKLISNVYIQTGGFFSDKEKVVNGENAIMCANLLMQGID